MKKMFIVLLLLFLMTTLAEAKGNFKKLKCDGFTVHVYNSHDLMEKTSLIVEGKQSLVLMELPLFKRNMNEFIAYAVNLKKNIIGIISNYHEGYRKGIPTYIPKTMHAFYEGKSYREMMEEFKNRFGDDIVLISPGVSEEIDFGETKILDAIDFTFTQGPQTDFPAANIIIGHQVYYTHWAFAKAHPNAHLIKSEDSIAILIDEAKAALASNCPYFVGGHGGYADREIVDFFLGYLLTMQKALKECDTPEEFTTFLTKAYPNLPKTNQLESIAENLYAHRELP